MILKTKAQGKASPLVKKAIQNELKLIKNSLEQISSDLRKLEKKHKISSKKFYSNYKKGKTTDSLDFVDWAGTYQLFLDLKEQYEELKELQIC